MTEHYRKQIDEYVDAILKAREDLQEEKTVEEKPKVTKKIKKKK